MKMKFEVFLLLVLGSSFVRTETDTFKPKAACEVCIEAAQRTGMFVQSQSGMDTINTIQNYVCSILPMKNKCKKIFEDIQEFTLEVSSSITPLQACKLINMCQEPETCSSTTVPTCKDCQLVAKDALASLESPVIRSSVASMVNSACATIKETGVRDACTKFFGSEFASILHAAADNVESRTICEFAGYCQRSGTPIVKQPPTVCTLCLRSVEEVQKFVESKDFQDAVRALVQTVCKLTGPYEDRCITTVNKALEKIVQEILRDKPDAVCKKWHFCAED